MRVLARVLLWAGRVYLALAAIVILIGLATILVRDGVWHLWEVASPFNLWNAFAVILTLAPGLALVWVAERIGTEPPYRAGTDRPRRG
jgi:hypothetical protein